MKITEKHIQAILMRWCLLYKNHETLITNSRGIVHWEADLLSWTRAFRMHEFEIKLNIYDYRADFKKRWKHMGLKQPLRNNIPNHFWYVTCNFFIRPPEEYGWIYIEEKNGEFDLYINKWAPLLHTRKIDLDFLNKQLRRHLSHRLHNNYFRNTIVNENIGYYEFPHKRGTRGYYKN